VGSDLPGGLGKQEQQEAVPALVSEDEFDVVLLLARRERLFVDPP